LVEGSKRFFFEKKNQKTFESLRAMVNTVPSATGHKSFLVLFFKKEPLALFQDSH
jgi:hypothetical protein